MPGCVGEEIRGGGGGAGEVIGGGGAGEVSCHMFVWAS